MRTITPTKIKIFIVVDSIRALIDQSLEGNCTIVDDSPYAGENQGTLDIITNCYPGERIEWVVKAIDVQTPVSIKEISFESKYPECSFEETKNLDTLVWKGSVPYKGVYGKYCKYKIVLQIGKGVKSELVTYSPVLRILP